VVKPLVEYQAIIGKGTDALTSDEAKALLEWEKQISPEVPSKLSTEVVNRFVTHPWDQALAAQRGGDAKLATQLAQAVLKVSPQHAGAKAMLEPEDAGKPAPKAKKPADAGR
jgi:hypothetical protein